MDEKIYAVDRISDLPDFILHHILSLLSRKEAAKTGLLSKKWNCVWSSFPILDFNQTHYLNLHSPSLPDTRPESQKRVEKFMNDVDKSISRFHKHQLPMQKFILNMTLVDFKLASLVHKWIGMALEHGVKEIDLRVRTKRNTWYCLPGTIFFAKSTNNCKLEQPFSWSALNYYSLQKLWLSKICVNEEVIQAIFRSCPFITDFGITGCYGWKTLDISKLPKLCRVNVLPLDQKVEIVRVEATNLEYFRFRYSGECLLNITACQNLTKLYLEDLWITDQWLQSNISRFSHLEVLEVCNCKMLERVKISVQSLRYLIIMSCQKLLEVDIDSPNLSSFQFDSLRNVIPMISSRNAPCPFNLTFTLLEDDHIDTLWLHKLREFLVMSNQRKVLTLRILCQEVAFSLEELKGITIPPSFELEHMTLDLRMRPPFIDTIDHGSLIDGLLWSCYPKKLSLRTGLKSRENCIKVLCEKVLDREDLDYCCSCHPKCWRHHLKGAKIISIPGIEDERLLNCKTLFDVLPTLDRNHAIQFRLDWDHHLHGEAT
ncbi:F-box/LRR-repeat protein At5g02910-like [Castanea sativa]|uniref:F-box/LRR-repeat protein At5g02910-like n=1 Tax=Castanea sativa TaxID=21020 RepID=UPI003F64CE89